MVTEFSLVLILLCVVVLPVAAVAFARSGKAYDEIGKGRFAVDFDESGGAEHHEEIRQLVEAKAYRQARRGEEPVDVEAEVERLPSQAEGPRTPRRHISGPRSARSFSPRTRAVSAGAKSRLTWRPRSTAYWPNSGRCAYRARPALSSVWPAPVPG